MTTSKHASFQGKDVRMHETCVEIVRKLRAELAPVLAEPLPRELRHLVTQLVALETAERRSGERAVEALQLEIAQPAGRPGVYWRNG